MRRLGLFTISLLPAGMLLLTLTDHWRYGFFILLRWVVSGSAPLLALMAHDQDSPGWMWVMVGVLVLFNPLLPIHLRRDTWRVLDLLAAILFLGAHSTLLPFWGRGTLESSSSPGHHLHCERSTHP